MIRVLLADDRIAFREALTYPFVAHHGASSLWALMTQAAAETGQEIESQIQVSSFECMCRLVEAGFGLALLPEGVLGAHIATGTLRIVQLKDAWATRQLVVVVRDLETLPFSTRALIDHLRSCAASDIT